MASTQSANIDFNSDYFTDTMEGVFTQRNAALSSGVMEEVPGNGNFSGFLFQAPWYDTLSGDSQVISSASSAATVNAMGTLKSSFPMLEREKAFGWEQMLKIYSQSDPTAEAARQIATYVANETHRIAGVVTNGAFASASLSAVNAYTPGSALTNDAAVTAKGLIGDNQDVLSSVIWHSAIHNKALKEKWSTPLDNTNGQADAYRKGVVYEYLGCMTYQSDSFCAATAGVYPTYFAAPGSIIYKFRPRSADALNGAVRLFNINAGPVQCEVELSRTQAGGGTDIMTIRFSLGVGIKGVEWGVAAAEGTTDAALATGTNWALTSGIDNKLVRIVQLNTTA